MISFAHPNYGEPASSASNCCTGLLPLLSLSVDKPHHEEAYAPRKAEHTGAEVDEREPVIKAQVKAGGHKQQAYQDQELRKALVNWCRNPHSRFHANQWAMTAIWWTETARFSGQRVAIRTNRPGFVPRMRAVRHTMVTWKRRRLNE